MAVMITNYITMWVVNCRIILAVDKQGIMSSSIKEEHKPNDSLGATEQASLAPGRSSLAL